MNKKKILVVIESLDVDDSSATKGRLALIKNLHRAGYYVKVYHYTRKEITLEAITTVSIKERKFSANYVFSKIQVLLWRSFRLNINPFFEQRFGFSFSYFNDVSSIRKSLLKEKDFRPDWVLTLSKAASFRVHKSLLGIPKWHDRWLAYVHDPFPHHFYPRPYNWVEPGYHQKQEFFREISKKSKYAIFPSQLLKEWMGSYYPDFLEKGIVIPHQISDENVPLKKSVDYFDKDKFNILYAGNLMKPRDPKGLIQGFKKFVNEKKIEKREVQLLIVGNHPYYKEYLDIEKSKTPELYVSDGYINYDEVAYMQENAAINVILEAKAEISPFLPGKFPHCVKANKPILYLGPSLSESRRLLGQDYMYSAEIDDEKAVFEHLCTIHALWSANSEKYNLSRPDLVEYMSYNYLDEKIASL